MVELKWLFTVSPAETDEKGFLRAVGIQKALMQASNLHSDQLGCGWEAMRQKGVFWVISRIRFQFFRRPLAGERLEILTWPNPAGIAGVDRNYRVSDAKGYLVAEAMAKWSIVDVQEGKPVRAMDYPLVNPHLNYSLEQVWAVGFERFRDYSEAGDPFVDRRILAEDIDENGHVNNTRYIVFAEEAAKTVLGKSFPYLSFQISFLAPLFVGETVSMRVHREDGMVDVEGSVLRNGRRLRSFRCKMA